MKNEGTLTGLLLGAGLMYYLDPDRGRRRRALVRDRAVHYGHAADDAVETAARDMRNRARGMAAEARSRLQPESPPPAQVIEARVRSELGRLTSHPGAVSVVADENGRVTVRGPVLASEADRLVAGIESVRGVHDVIDRTERHESAEGISALQGSGRVPRAQLDVLQQNWAPATRMLMGSLGAALALRGMRGDGPLRSLMALGGMGILSRSLTNKDARRLLGIAGGSPAVEVHKAITIEAPVEEVFDFWRNYENFPRFMSHLSEVRQTGGGRSHWVAEGPGGVPFEWDAETVRMERNRAIEWRSAAGSPVENAGAVHFRAEGENTTRVDVHLSYNPPAGAVGHAVAAFFRSDPKHMMDDDLVRVKSLLEDGRTTAHGHTVMRDDVRRAIEGEGGTA